MGETALTHADCFLGRRAGLRNKRILLVEDEALVSMVVEDVLRDAGAEILGPAPSVGEALRLVEAAAADGGIDAAVLDINLRGHAVVPVADKLAALGVPFVFATGYSKGLGTGEHGAAPTLCKPFSTEYLVELVATLAASPPRPRGGAGPDGAAGGPGETFGHRIPRSCGTVAPY